MKEKLIIFLLIFSLTVNLAALITLGYFWGKSERPGTPAFRMGKPTSLVSELPLDNGQWRKMRGLRRNLLKEITPIRDELMTKRGELVNLFTLEKPDRQVIDQKLREISGLQLQTQAAVIDQLLKEKEFLNPKQQKHYFDLICNKLCPGQCAMENMPRDYKGSGMGRGPRRGMGWGDGSRRGRGQWQGE